MGLEPTHLWFTLTEPSAYRDSVCAAALSALYRIAFRLRMSGYPRTTKDRKSQADANEMPPPSHSGESGLPVSVRGRCTGWRMGQAPAVLFGDSGEESDDQAPLPAASNYGGEWCEQSDESCRCEQTIDAHNNIVAFVSLTAVQWNIRFSGSWV